MANTKAKKSVAKKKTSPKAKTSSKVKCGSKSVASASQHKNKTTNSGVKSSGQNKQKEKRTDNTIKNLSKNQAKKDKSKDKKAQNLKSKPVNKDKQSVIMKLLAVLGLVSKKKQYKIDKYNNQNIGQIRRVRNKETSGHFAYTITKKGSGPDAEFGYVSITTDGKRNDIEKLIKNPNPNDKRDSYVVNKAKFEKAKKFGKMQRGWRLTKKDKKHIKEIYKKNSRNKPAN